MKFPPLVVFVFILAGGLDPAFSQISTSVENLSPITSGKVRDGLGFNLAKINNEWEFRVAAEAGATEVRFQPAWSLVENMNGELALMPAHEKALDWCATYKLKPLLVAGYGPPYQSIGHFTLAQDAPIGTTSLSLKEDLSQVVVPYCHIMEVKGQQIVPISKWGYYGALIAGVDPTAHTITLAAATNIALTAGQSFLINRLLYPSCATASPTDPSIVAYARYAAFLADRIAAHGLSGRVELWNEPPWAHDPWDHRGAFYDTPPPDVITLSANFGIAEVMATAKPPAGVRYNWAGPHKTGSASLLNDKRMAPPITAQEVADSITSESYHPYSSSPEDDLWDPAVLASCPSSGIIKSTLPGASWSANFRNARWMNLQKPELNLQQNITETGVYTADNVGKARSNLRQYLGFLGDGFERVTFYVLAQPAVETDTTYGFVDEVTQKTTQAYVAIQGLVVTDMSELPANPVTYSPADLPAVSSYSGTYPLMTVPIVGRHTSTDPANSIYFVAWQRSHAPPGPVNNLVVGSATTEHVTLKWVPDNFAVSSTVQRALISGGPYTAVASDLTAFTFTDQSVTPGNTYYYTVVGSNPAGTSSNSNEVSVSLPADGEPTSNNKSRPAGPGQIKWLDLPSPAPGQVTLVLPGGDSATKAWNLVTRAKVPFQQSGNEVKYPVTDDPVCVAIEASSFKSKSPQ